ncbi:MAG TPA: hypothetical protein V6D22_11260 [Candidatus Obscuribacterales bacterium]
MEAFDLSCEKELIAKAKDCSWASSDTLAPKRCNPLDLLAETSVTCLTRIAENSSIPPSMLEQLALHSHPAVREAVADNMNTPIDTLWVLSGDECAEVRYAIAENHNVPLAILSALSCDDNPYISTRAQSTINRLTGATLITGDFPAYGSDSRVLRMG